MLMSFCCSLYEMLLSQVLQVPSSHATCYQSLPKEMLGRFTMGDGHFVAATALTSPVFSLTFDASLTHYFGVLRVFERLKIFKVWSLGVKLFLISQANFYMVCSPQLTRLETEREKENKQTDRQTDRKKERKRAYRASILHTDKQSAKVLLRTSFLNKYPDRMNGQFGLAVSTLIALSACWEGQSASYWSGLWLSVD